MRAARTWQSRQSLWYWLLVFALVGFGWIAIFSIGAPFLLLGVALAVLFPFRGRARLFWPALGAVAALILGVVLVTPLGCMSIEFPAGSAFPTRTTCSNLIGIAYSGTGDYSPPHWPALLAGLAAGAAGFAGLRFLVRKTTRPNAA
jgi:hypothetical protein